MAHMLDGLIGGVSYWATGWGLSYGRGTSSLVGGSNFFGYEMDSNLAPLWFFQFVCTELKLDVFRFIRMGRYCLH